MVLAVGAVEAVQRLGGDWFRWTASTDYNPAFQEGLAWRLGRLDLRYWLFDTALVEEQQCVYNVYPPFQSVVGLVAALFTISPDAVPPPGAMPVYRWLPFVLFFLPVPLAAYGVFARRTGSAIWSAVLTAALVGGTAVMPCIAAARRDDFHHVNHLLATTGLLLLAGEMLGRRRLWVMLAGLLVAAWSRQLAGLFAIAMVYVVWLERGHKAVPARPAGAAGGETGREGPPILPTATAETGGAPRRPWVRRGVAMATGLAVIIGVPMALNLAKFGDPFDSGYLLIYRGRDTQAAKNAREHGLFSPQFLKTNAYYMNIAVPWARNEAGRLTWRPSPHGGSLWLSTPLAALALAAAVWWWRDRAARALMLCSLPVMAAHLFYHNTGYVQHGYYRFALDYLPVWLVVAAPWLCTGWRRWPTLACAAWGLAYFGMVRHWSGPNAM